MNRIIAAIVLLCIIAPAHAQPLSAVATVNNYNIAQRRLLLVSTAQFVNFITKDELDQDSVMLMACRITGMPFLILYNEGFAGKLSPAENLINAGKIHESVLLLNNLKGENRIQLLVELGIWYLHKTGSHKTDLAFAARYIRLASALASADKYSDWQNECQSLTGELYYQSGRIRDSRRCFLDLISGDLRKANPQRAASALLHLANLLPFEDSMKLVYLNHSLQLYRQLKLKEKEIELLGNISACHHLSDLNLMGKDLQQMLSLQQSTGFKHILYTQYRVSQALLAEGKYINGLDYAKAAFENMKWSGFAAVSSTFYLCVGKAYVANKQNEAGLLWLKKGLETRSKGTQLFWYKSLLYAATLLTTMDRSEESLALLNSITREFPPQTLWQSIQVLLTKGACYESLSKPKLIDQTYMSLLALTDRYSDKYSELGGDYWYIANYYASNADLKKAGLFLKKALAVGKIDSYSKVQKYLLLFKIDSMEGNYKSAFQNHVLYKAYFDARNSRDQERKLDELKIKYAADKKDRDIKFLRQQEIVRQRELERNRLSRNIVIAGTILLLVIAALIYNQYLHKLKSNKLIARKNELLRRLLTEKEWLLKEVHHRVKNNLHTVIALLESQAAYLENDALKAIETSRHRIYAMSLIHQKLYQSEEVKAIEMEKYLPEFISYLSDCFDTSGQIHFQLNVEALTLGISQAIPIALIINEAVTNSIKYAFPENRKGNMQIDMHKYADQITLVISDNGIGIDESVLNFPSESLGLKLIKGLSADIDASINIRNDHGTRISIAFNVDPFYNNLKVFRTQL